MYKLIIGDMEAGITVIDGGRERTVLEGFSYEFDDELLNEFFNAFPYELTKDQEKAYLDKKYANNPYYNK